MDVFELCLIYYHGLSAAAHGREIGFDGVSLCLDGYSA